MLTGKFHITANERKSYEIFQATSEIIFFISEILVNEFGCTRPQIPTIGADTVITECDKGDIKIYVGWDNWSGFYLFADSHAGDKFVDRIGSHINTLLATKQFQKFEDKTNTQENNDPHSY